MKLRKKWGRSSSGATPESILNKTCTAVLSIPTMLVLAIFRNRAGSSSFGQFGSVPAQYRNLKGKVNYSAKNMPITKNRKKACPPFRLTIYA